MSRAIVGMITTIAIFVSLYFVITNGLKNIEDAEKWLAYENGVCRFIDGLPDSECGAQKGLDAYNKWYSEPGSWVYGENPRLGHGIGA